MICTFAADSIMWNLFFSFIIISMPNDLLLLLHLQHRGIRIDFVWSNIFNKIILCLIQSNYWKYFPLWGMDGMVILCVVHTHRIQFIPTKLILIILEYSDFSFINAWYFSYESKTVNVSLCRVLSLMLIPMFRIAPTIIMVIKRCILFDQATSRNFRSNN